MPTAAAPPIAAKLVPGVAAAAPSRADWSKFFRGAPPVAPPRVRAEWLPVALVAAAAAVLAIVTYLQFLQVPRSLWYVAGHDRSAHYLFGQGIALELRSGSVFGLLRAIHSARVWPPLHGLLVGLVQAVGGIDYRLAVLPSLSAWMVACVFAFLTARRLVPHHGNLAGLTAALFLAASPAHRSYATDVMLESLGCGLIVASLYFYLVAVQDRKAWAGRCLGLSLTALFLTKYNFWMLLTAGLTLGTIASHWPAVCSWIANAAETFNWRGWLRQQLRHPMTYLLVISALLTAGIVVATTKAPVTITIGTYSIELRTTQTLAHVTFVLLVLRLLPWWWQAGRFSLRRVDLPARSVVAWHGYPLVLWFLWPQRLGFFLWYVTFCGHGRSGECSAWTGNLAYYWSCLIQDYHAGLGLVVLALVLAVVAGLLHKRLRPGGAAILVFLVVAALITNYHPANRSRFLLPWIATMWVAAGAGLALVVGSGWLQRLRLGNWVGTAAVMGLGVVLLPSLCERGHSEEGGPRPDRPCLLDLADVYLPELDNCRQPTLFSNGYLQFFLHWTYAERNGRDRPVIVNPEWDQGSDDPAAFRHWLEATPSDALLYIEVTPDSPGDRPVWPESAERVRRRLEEQSVFVPVRTWKFPQFAGCTMSLWKRAEKLQSAK